MNRDEQRLSDYIDSLNEEKRPEEHNHDIETTDMEELFKTVRLVKSLKEASMPSGDFVERLEESLSKKVPKKKESKRRWFYGAASVAAAVAIVFALNILTPFGNTNVVYAMEKAFQGVKAYHGYLQIQEKNAEGKSITEAKMEVWADKEGHYYVKQLEGSDSGMVTVNNGKNKWQIQPEQKQVNEFAAFPDPYSFSFELGKEVNNIEDAVQTKVIGDDTVAGREASIVEVTPKGGTPYKIWIDKVTKMPLQKQSAMENSVQYQLSYTEIDFADTIPSDLLTLSVPQGFKEVNANPEQLVNSVDEAKDIVGFTPKQLQSIPTGYTMDNVAVVNTMKDVKISYTSKDNNKKVVVIQGKASGELKPSSMSVLGKVGNNTSEIQAPVQEAGGILGSGTYSGETDINSIRWQQDGLEYAVVGNVSLEELTAFIKSLTNSDVQIPSAQNQLSDKPQIQVPVDLEAEKGDQKNADSGHSPWKLDPAFVTQVFVSLKISPQGIQGDYPIKMEDIKVIKNTGKEAVVEVSGEKTPIRKVYLKKLIREDSTGIWTVVGYDPVEKK